MMAILTFEDMIGSIEVLVFPRDYEKLRGRLSADAKVFIRGRVSVEEDKPAKLLLSDVKAFDEIPSDIYIRYPSSEAFLDDRPKLTELLSESDGTSSVIAYIKSEGKMYPMPQNLTVSADRSFIDRLKEVYGEDNVALKYKNLTFSR